MCKSWGPDTFIISYEPDRTGDFPFKDEILTTLCWDFRKKDKACETSNHGNRKERLSSEMINIVIIYHTNGMF
jgi:hypothetical protein